MAADPSEVFTARCLRRMIAVPTRRDTMAWALEGRYVENCSCDAICPCTWSNLALPATREDCRAVLAFQVERGTVEDVDVAGRTVVLVANSPRMMAEGHWRVGLIFDGDTTDEQMAGLSKVFTGEVGGPFAALAPLITEVLGTERAPVRLEEDADGWHLRVGDDSEFRGTAARGPEGADAVTLTGIVVHPAGPTLTVTPGDGVRSSLFGIDWSGDGRSGFAAPFSWAA
jgi:hypothetical protein